MPKIMSVEEKLQIMKRYVQETGKEIQFGTIYKGYNLGGMKNNLRQKDFRGKLDISSELRKEFERIGVLGERERRRRTSDHEKYKIIVDYLDGKEVDLPDNIFKQYMRWLQTHYNRGIVNLSSKEIEDLRRRNVLKETPKTQEEFADTYSISTKVARYIIHHFGSIEQFTKRYKAGEINPSELNGIFVRPRIIAISSKEISASQLSKCVTLFGKLISVNALQQGDYINIDKLVLEFGKLDNKEKRIIINQLRDKKNRKSLRQLAKEIGIGANYPGELLRRIIGRWVWHRGVVGNIKRCEDEQLKKAYKRAYNHFMECENVLNPNEVIPASIQVEHPIGEQKKATLSDELSGVGTTLPYKKDDGR